jgi:hypothetical protein
MAEIRFQETNKASVCHEGVIIGVDHFPNVLVCIAELGLQLGPALTDERHVLVFGESRVLVSVAEEIHDPHQLDSRKTFLGGHVHKRDAVLPGIVIRNADHIYK